jgi:MoxR-like ATPase
MSTTATPQIDSEALKLRIERFRQVQSDIVTQVRRVIVGQEEVLEQVMIGLFVGGHCLITGLPGTAKTLLVRTLAQTLGLVFKRIQFTPDLMPSDITGTDIIEEDPATGRRTWTFVEGPIFGNILLADEINRTPPKTQSARTVLCAGDAEPHRAGGHLPAARSAARPLSVQHRARLPHGR